MPVNLLEQRTIEAAILGPVIKAFAEELGWEKAKEILTRVHTEAARQYGQALAQELGSAEISDLVRESAKWNPDGALDEEIIEQTDKTFHFNVTRCRYAEEYEALGLRGLGYALSCCRDDGFIEGFNPKIKMTRTKTVMEGGDCCDFRYTKED